MDGVGSNGWSRKLKRVWRGDIEEKERGGMINNGWVENYTNYITP
jgi:hypothetical protein